MEPTKQRKVLGSVSCKITFAEAYYAMRQIINHHQNAGDGRLLFTHHEASNLERMADDIREMIADAGDIKNCFVNTPGA